MTKHPKLELTWIGKENRPRLEPRVLLEDPEKSYHAAHRVKDWPQENAKNTKDSVRSLRSFAAKSDSAVGDLFDNRLIFGDNLLALKALEQEFAGKIKCIYIDPPYNTGSAFTHYDDGVEHSIWLSLMRDRLEILRRLLSEDGSIWVNLDDNEGHYCRVLMDEVFGRPNFLADVIWEKADSPRMDVKLFSSRSDHILVFAKNAGSVAMNRLTDDEVPQHYSKTDEVGRRYYLKPLRAMGSDGFREKRPSMYYGVVAPDGATVFPMNPDGSDSRWRWGQDKLERDKHLLEWVKTKSGWSLYFRIYHENSAGKPPETIWFNADVGSNRTSKAEIKGLFGSEVFDTPKPEGLIRRVVHIASNPGDWVLDSFAGSGTTGAVAHKMGRRWIMVELGEHCHTHIIPRLKKVIDGEDPGGISKAVNWDGGGGFRYYKLAPSLLEKDKWGNWIISKEYNAALLAEALCKLEGFRYEPSESVYWQQGRSTERDFLYVTTQNLNASQLAQLNDEVGEGRSLLVLCPAFRGNPENWPNLTVKKIPRHVMTRCEWGHDDYSLNVANLPKAPPKPGQLELSLD